MSEGDPHRFIHSLSTLGGLFSCPKEALMTTADHRDDAPESELYGDEHEPIEDDTADQMIDGEHPDGDYPPEIYDDDPDEPIEDEPADEEVPD